MIGNVWEWCLDWFNKYEYKHRGDGIKDPQSPKEGVMRVLHGGSFLDFRSAEGCAYRCRNDPDSDWEDAGFRVALFPTKKPES